MTFHWAELNSGPRYFLVSFLVLRTLLFVHSNTIAVAIKRELPVMSSLLINKALASTAAVLLVTVQGMEHRSTTGV